MTPKPPWRARNKREQEHMHKWCNEQLGWPPTQRAIVQRVIGAPNPARPRGRPKTVSLNLEDAVQDVRRIRELWKKHEGKQNRHADDGPSAVEIAARRWKVKKSAIEEQLKRGK